MVRHFVDGGDSSFEGVRARFSVLYSEAAKRVGEKRGLTPRVGLSGLEAITQHRLLILKIILVFIEITLQSDEESLVGFEGPISIGTQLVAIISVSQMKYNRHRVACATLVEVID